jgi:chromosome transmission fidelity protein 18
MVHLTQTTLAHIVAQHCGYTPLEVNASDDRSPERLREILATATLNATLSADQKPNCVILDEVDGIDGSRSALDGLVGIIKAPLRAGSAAAAAAAAGKGGKGASTASSSHVFALTRPLICICNDQYAPALREIVKLADVFVFTGKTKRFLSFFLQFFVVRSYLAELHFLDHAYFLACFTCSTPQLLKMCG